MLDSLDLDAALRPRAHRRGRRETRRWPERKQTRFSRRQPTHLLGLILAGERGAHAEGRRRRARRTATSSSPRRQRSARSKLPEYITHENDITIALDALSGHDDDHPRRAQPRLRRRVHVLRARGRQDRYGRTHVRPRAAGHRDAQPARDAGRARGHRGLDPRLRVSLRPLRAAAARRLDGRSLRTAPRRRERRWPRADDRAASASRSPER